jgi:very-short-patch-repair endonuclease
MTMRLYRNQPSGTVPRAQQLRREASPSERRLLRALREAFPALKWRHQAPVGPFYADILCFSEAMVIEVDGDTHAGTVEQDASRTRFIEREGYRMLRFWNNEVMENTEGVIAQISLSLREREGARSAKPSGKGEGDRKANSPRSPSPRAATRLAPLPMGEGK